MKTFSTSGTGNQQTLSEIESDKIPIYDSLTDATADLANLTEGQIGATKDTGSELSAPVDTVQSGNMHAVTSNAVASQFKLLWENSTPSDVFLPQSIPLPTMNEYSMLLIVLNWASYSQVVANSQLIVVGQTSCQLSVDSYDNANSLHYFANRNATIGNNSIDVSQCAIWAGVVLGDVRNDLCIPLKIYGIR